MQITEKTFRRILKEEARRILKEEAAPPITTAEQAEQAINSSTSDMDSNPASLFLFAWKLTSNILNSMKSNKEILALSNQMVGAGGNVLDIAIAKWNGVLVSIANGGSGKGILDVISTQVAISSAANSDVAMFAALALSKSFNTETEAEKALGLLETAFVGGKREKFKAACAGLFSSVAKCESQFMNANEINKIISQGASATGSPPTQGDVTHTIVAGESISKIAQDYYGIEPSQAAMPVYNQMANRIQPGASNRAASGNPNQIFPGQVILLPPTVTLAGRRYNRIKK